MRTATFQRRGCKSKSDSHDHTEPALEKVDSVPFDMRLARPINDLLTGG